MLWILASQQNICFSAGPVCIGARGPSKVSGSFFQFFCPLVSFQRFFRLLFLGPTASTNQPENVRPQTTRGDYNLCSPPLPCFSYFPCLFGSSRFRGRPSIKNSQETRYNLSKNTTVLLRRFPEGYLYTGCFVKYRRAFESEFARVKGNENNLHKRFILYCFSLYYNFRI